MSEPIEERIRAAAERDDLAAAATVALEGYGDEVFGFLVARMRSQQDANDVFSILTEDLWRGLAAFRWQSSFRTWLYTLARHAALRFERSPANQVRRRVDLSQISEVMDRVRTRTFTFLQTETEDRFRELRSTLSTEEQTLLILRVDRQLSWNEVARIMSDDVNADEGELVATAARLRQRFQTVKRRLRQRAEAAGLLESRKTH